MRNTLALLILLGIPTTLSAQDTPPPPPPAAQAVGGSYSLHPGDIVKIEVWTHKEFSGQFQVNERGVIQYPIIGEIDTRNLTVALLRDRIRAGLAQLFKQPFVTITPLFRMAVLGEVRTPGLYTVDPTLSVLDVVALAGGVTENANMNKVRLFRRGTEAELGFRRAGLGGRTLQEIGIRSGDQIVVPRRSWTRDDWFILLQITQVALSVAIFINTLK